MSKWMDMVGQELLHSSLDARPLSLSPDPLHPTK